MKYIHRENETKKKCISHAVPTLGMERRLHLKPDTVPQLRQAYFLEISRRLHHETSHQRAQRSDADAIRRQQVLIFHYNSNCAGTRNTQKL